ncbi:MAG: hypothetical protein R3Y43_04285 [Alphaproteobacteria bacterium]
MKIYSKELLYSQKSQYDIDAIVLETSTSGTSSIEILENGLFELTVVGAGAGSCKNSGVTGTSIDAYATGGSGGCFKGNVNLSKGTYQVVVGAAGLSYSAMATSITAEAGGNSQFGSIIRANGASAASTPSITSVSPPSYGGSVEILDSSVISSIAQQSTGNDGPWEVAQYNSISDGGSSVHEGGYYGQGAGLGGGENLGYTIEGSIFMFWGTSDPPSVNGYVKLVYKGKQ